MTSSSFQSLFFIGQCVHHKKFDYRGVIVDVDATFQGTEEWYQQVALSRPPKDRPWYHVLVNNSDQSTYVAERHLQVDDTNQPIQHPAVDVFFDEFKDGIYTRSMMQQ